MKSLKLLMLLVFCSIPMFTNAQIIPWGENRPLTWNDFAGLPDKNSDFDAHTSCYLHYAYRWERRDTIYKLYFKIESGFDSKNSWAVERRENEDILKHEQLHFDIHELYVRRLVNALKQATYTKNFKQEVADIVQQQYEARYNAQKKYDEDTNHSKDEKMQRLWEDYIHIQLKAISKNY